MSNEEFCKTFTELVEKTIPYLKLKKTEVTNKDVEGIYNNAGKSGVLSPLYAVYNLRHSYLSLRIPLTREDENKFECCIEHAGNHLENYSVYQSADDRPVLDLPTWTGKIEI